MKNRLVQTALIVPKQNLFVSNIFMQNVNAAQLCIIVKYQNIPENGS